jgi:general secretion pathway protein F
LNDVTQPPAPSHDDAVQQLSTSLASERSGQLVRALQDHAAYLTWSQALRARLLAACIYPLLLLGAGLAVVLFLLLYVLPRFATVFEGLGDQVPAAFAG